MGLVGRRGACSFAHSSLGVAGVLAFPFAYSQTGLLLGLLVTIFQIFVCSLTLQWLGQACRRAAPEDSVSYEKLWRSVYGNRLAVVVGLFLFIGIFGAMVAIVIITGDMISPIAQHFFGDSLFTRRGFITLVVVSCVGDVSVLPKVPTDLPGTSSWFQYPAYRPFTT